MAVLVLVADCSEEIEVVTVVDVLRRAKLAVTLAAVGDNIHVVLSRQVELTANVRLKEVARAVDTFDAIILPGGLQGAKVFATDSVVQQLLKAFESAGKLVAAMCASTTALQAAGIGKGKRATSYPMFKEQLQGFYDYRETPVVCDTKLITSRGPGTAMAWALAIIGEICGMAAAKEVADQLLLMFAFP